VKLLRQILETVRGLHPSRHAQFREWCALAAAGHLGGPQMVELNQHLTDCEPCRDFLESVTRASALVIPVLASDRMAGEVQVPPAGMRSRFLSRLAAETSRSEHSAPLVLVASGEKQFSGEASRGRSFVRTEALTGIARNESSGWVGWTWAGAAVAACAIVGLISYHMGRSTGRAPVAVPQTVGTAVSAPVRDVKPADSPRLVQLEREKSAIEDEVAHLTLALAQARSERETLNAELMDARAQLAGLNLQVSASRQARDSSSLQDPRGQIGALKSEIDALTLKLADSEAKANAQQRLNEDITAKLDATDSELHRERELESARTEVSDLVAARNLHIVDVYDSDGKGKRQQAFGRVFYTEGKSLVFYAYDLQEAHRVDASVIFHVWGEKAGLKPVAHSLGLLHNDSPKDGRWSMTFDDPAVLAQINSVFVTVENTDKHSTEPRGRKVLYAYFGSTPNHP
jgi:hypothetical protein